MIVKSFRKQLQSIFTVAGYKSAGVLVPCHSELRPGVGVTFRINIAHQIYQKYRREHFKFSEKGVTPQSLAQQIAVFTHQSDHYHFDIDSFGNIFITPTKYYYKKMKQYIIQNNRISHFPIQLKTIDFIRQKNTPKYILYNANDTSLSSLRIINHLQLICKKNIILQEQSTSNIIKLIDFSKLHQSQSLNLLQMNTINTRDFPVKFIINKFGEEFNYNNNLNNNIDYTQNFHKQGLKEPFNFISGCLRHKTINFSKNYSKFIKQEQENNIIKFGEVFPFLTIEQLKNIYPVSYKQQILNILKYTTMFDAKLPINLRQKMTSSFPFSDLTSLFQNRQLSQVYLLILDCLGNDKIIQIHHMIQSLKKQEMALQDRSLFQLFEDGVRNILN